MYWEQMQTPVDRESPRTKEERETSKEVQFLSMAIIMYLPRTQEGALLDRHKPPARQRDGNTWNEKGNSPRNIGANSYIWCSRPQVPPELHSS
jgi:hypothetical protein